MTSPQPNYAANRPRKFYGDREYLYHTLLSGSGNWYTLRTRLKPRISWEYLGHKVPEGVEIPVESAEEILRPMIVPGAVVSPLKAMKNLVAQLGGSPYIVYGFSLAGTDCDGLANALANLAAHKPAFSWRTYDVPNLAEGLKYRKFKPGKGGAGDLTIGWCGAPCDVQAAEHVWGCNHCACILPDLSTASGGEEWGVSRGVKPGIARGYLDHFTNWMHRPVW